MNWLDNIKKELEVSKNHPIRKKKDFEIDRLIRLNGDKKQMSERGKNNHKKKIDTGWYDLNKEKYQKQGKIILSNLTEEQENKRRKNLSNSNKKRYKENPEQFKDCLTPGNGGIIPSNRIFEDYKVKWIKEQYNRKKDIFGKKIVYQRIANALDCSLYTVYSVIKNKSYKEIQ